MNETNGFIRWLAPDHQETADLAVITVPWNSKDLLLENIEHLFKSQGSITAELIVVDNASQDGVVAAVRERFANVRVIANETNRGFSAANNQGIAVMHARHVLLLNPDMRVESDALQKTVEYLDAHPDVGIIGGRLTRPNGSIVKSVRHFPDFWSQLIIMCKLPHLALNVLKKYLWEGFHYEREQEGEVLRGSYFAINRSALDKLGGLDERYFIWFEEVDYCKQVVQVGMKIMYVPTIRAIDCVGQSFKQVRLFLSQKRQTRSLITYFKKWHPRWQSAIFQILRPPLLMAAWIVDRGMKIKGIKEYKRIQT